MSAAHDSVSAYSATKQSWAGTLWADKARLRRVLMIWGVTAFLAIAAVVYLVGGRYVGSDDAYVHANKLMVSTDVSGLVKTVNVREGQQVKAGDIQRAAARYFAATGRTTVYTVLPGQSSAPPKPPERKAGGLL